MAEKNFTKMYLCTDGPENNIFSYFLLSIALMKCDTINKLNKKILYFVKSVIFPVKKKNSSVTQLLNVSKNGGKEIIRNFLYQLSIVKF